MRPDLKSQTIVYTRAQVGLAGGLLFLMGLIWFVAMRPADARLATVNGRIELQQRQLQTNQARLAALPEIRKQNEQLRLRLEGFDKKLPRHQDLPQLIGEVTQISRDASLNKLAWQPRAALRRTDLYLELPLDFTFQGDFLGVFTFLSDIEKMQRLTRLRKLDVQARDGMDGQVDVQLTMNIYFSEE